MHKKRSGLFLIYGLAAAVLITLDQLVKLWAIANLQGQPERTLIPGFVHLTYLENTGAAFGFLAGFGGAQVVLTVVKLVVMAAAVLYFAILPREARFHYVRIPVTMIIAGGVGNLIDRLRLGFVVDMFAFSFFEFPVFNVADIYVTVGVFLLLIIVMLVVRDAPLLGSANAEKTEE